MAQPLSDMDRRPVPGRRWRLTLWVADRLLAWGLSPNGASWMGMAWGVIGGLAFASTSLDPGWVGWGLGALAIFLRSVFNVLDGVMAHRSGRVTPLGGFLNDFTDRIADGAMLVGWGYAWGSSPVLGWAAAFGALMTAVVRLAGKVAGARMHYGGVMSKPVRMYVIIGAALGMAVWPSPVLAQGVLGVVGVGSAVTVVQRAVRISRDLRDREA